MISLLGCTRLKTFKPLEKVTVQTERKGLITVTDGEGREYFSSGIVNTVSFLAGGTLGRHNARLLDENGQELGKLSFKVFCETEIKDESGLFGELLTMLHYTMCSFPENQTSLVDGKVYKYFVWWLRDHVHTMKGMKYFHADLKSAIELYRDFQREDGMIWDLLGERKPPRGEHNERFEYDNFIKVVADGNRQLLRIPVENDVEYLFIEGIYFTWKATGDDGWMEGMLESAIKAYNYSLTSPYRWSEKYKLLKRGFTIDTWDFQDDEDARIAGGDIMVVYKDRSRFGIMHGDNTGFAAGCKYLAEMLEYTGKKDEAEKYLNLGREIKERLDKLAWNGKFYIHHIPEDENLKRDLGVDQSKQLSLSNAYALNRGLTYEQCTAIIKEYRKIKDNLPHGSQGEWYTIYPPFEWGFEEACVKWEYMNGGVTPIVAGELAHGAFENGFEEYGADILERIHRIAAENNGHLDCCLKGGQPEPVETVYSPLNLNMAANAAENVPGWDGTMREEYEEIPDGLVTKKGIPFHLPEPSQNGGKTCIGLMNVNPSSEIDRFGVVQRINGKGVFIGLKCRNDVVKEASLIAGEKASTIYLLHTMTGNGLAGDVTLEYSDGSSYTKYINEKKEILNWWLPVEPDYGENPKGDLVIAWEGKNHICGRAAVSLYGMENPRPEAEISRITFNAAKNGNYWTVLGVTLSDRPVKLKTVKSSYGIPDNWGAATVVYALLEGLAGVVDAATAYDKVRLSPRWTSAGIKSCSVKVKYPSSGGYCAYEYMYSKEKGTMEFLVTGSGSLIELRVLLPGDAGKVSNITVDGKMVGYKINIIENSEYAEFIIRLKGVSKVSVLFL